MAGLLMFCVNCSFACAYDIWIQLLSLGEARSSIFLCLFLLLFLFLLLGGDPVVLLLILLLWYVSLVGFLIVVMCEFRPDTAEG